MRKDVDAHKILLRKRKYKISDGSPRSRYEGNIKIII